MLHPPPPSQAPAKHHQPGNPCLVHLGCLCARGHRRLVSPLRLACHRAADVAGAHGSTLQQGMALVLSSSADHASPPYGGTSPASPGPSGPAQRVRRRHLNPAALSTHPAHLKGQRDREAAGAAAGVADGGAHHAALCRKDREAKRRSSGDQPITADRPVRWGRDRAAVQPAALCLPHPHDAGRRQAASVPSTPMWVLKSVERASHSAWHASSHHRIALPSTARPPHPLTLVQPVEHLVHRLCVAGADVQLDLQGRQMGRAGVCARRGGGPTQANTGFTIVCDAPNFVTQPGCCGAVNE